MTPSAQSNALPEKPLVDPGQSAVRTLAGLIVLWISMVLLFKANTISDQSPVVRLTADQQNLAAAETRPLQSNKGNTGTP